MEELVATDDNFNVDEMIREGQASIDREIADQYPLVSELIDIGRLHGEYAREDEVYQEKVKDLEQKYVSMRKTRPDGNCFYRAFFFAYFESLIKDPAEQERVHRICKESRKPVGETLGFPDFTVDEFYDYYNEIYNAIHCGELVSAEQLLAKLDEPSVSDNIVVYLRLLTSYYLRREADFFGNFIESGGGPIAEWCKREVEPMYKESDHIHIIALCSMLNVNIRVVYMDRGAGGKVNEHDFTPIYDESEENKRKGPRIHLLYRPGHYDILYIKQ